MRKGASAVKDLFDPEKPVMQVLGILSDFILLNLLFVLLCLPVVTAGAAAAALNAAMHYYYDTRSVSRLERFWRTFRASFRTAVAGQMVFLLAGVVLAADALFLLSTRFAGQGAAFALLFAAAAVWLAEAVWTFQVLAAQPGLTLRPALARAWKLAFARLPETLTGLVLALAPLAVLFIPMGWLYGYVLLMGLAGFSILAYIQARILLRRVWPPESGDEAL